MKAEEFDRLFDTGADITAHLDLSSTRRQDRKAVSPRLPPHQIDPAP